ncbi:hypothetical protein YC2023_040643 [Brassica napus]
MLKKQHNAPRLPASAPKPLLSDTDKGKGKEVSTQETRLLEGPPGFPPLFPELSKEEQQSAMMVFCYDKEGEQLQYISSKGDEKTPKTRSLPGQREIDEYSEETKEKTSGLEEKAPSTNWCFYEERE